MHQFQESTSNRLSRAYGLTLEDFERAFRYTLSMNKIISVAVGVVFNSRREVLLAWRDKNKMPSDCWEFPGGKIEFGESSYQALCRELQEEMAIHVRAAESLPSVRHQYATREVILHPWKIEAFDGIPRGNEGQHIAWFSLSQLRTLTLPAPNYLIVDSLFA